MTDDHDPYRHHPNLRGKIDDPEASFLRTFSNKVMEELADKHGLPKGWWYSDDQREALRARVLDGRWGRDLWVFAYGSLMWDPAIHFAEVRRARIDGYARRFILLDENGARGTCEAPGLFAALDAGSRCDGLVFRIAADVLDTETRILWQREQIAPGYNAVFLPADVGDGTVEALAFVADCDAANVRPDLTHAMQVDCIATGAGVLGTSADYLRGIVEKLDELGIDDAATRTLMADVDARLAKAG
ncbi:MAG: gamma-glutamylcyclotransferase [Pseudomonadota bacterium]